MNAATSICLTVPMILSDHPREPFPAEFLDDSTPGSQAVRTNPLHAYISTIFVPQLQTRLGLSFERISHLLIAMLCFFTADGRQAPSRPEMARFLSACRRLPVDRRRAWACDLALAWANGWGHNLEHGQVRPEVTGRARSEFVALCIPVLDYLLRCLETGVHGFDRGNNRYLFELASVITGRMACHTRTSPRYQAYWGLVNWDPTRPVARSLRGWITMAAWGPANNDAPYVRAKPFTEGLAWDLLAEDSKLLHFGPVSSRATTDDEWPRFRLPELAYRACSCGGKSPWVSASAASPCDRCDRQSTDSDLVAGIPALVAPDTCRAMPVRVLGKQHRPDAWVTHANTVAVPMHVEVCPTTGTPLPDKIGYLLFRGNGRIDDLDQLA